MEEDGDRFLRGCSLLRAMAASDREEAGVFLVGLVRYYADDLERLEIVADHLASFPHESAAEALLAELRRVPSSNTTRRYLDRVLRSLKRMPAELVEGGLRELCGGPRVLAEDASEAPGRDRRALAVRAGWPGVEVRTEIHAW